MDKDRSSFAIGFASGYRCSEGERGGGLAVAPAKTAGTQPPAIDRQALLNRGFNNRVFAMALLSELQSSARHQVAQIGCHLAKGQAHAAAEVAHSLKGAAAIVGALPLSRLAAEVEAAGHAGDLAKVQILSAKLSNELARCLAEIDQLKCELHKDELTNEVNVRGK